MFKRLLVPLTAALLLAAGCTDATPDNTATGASSGSTTESSNTTDTASGNEEPLTSSLITFDSCDTLLRQIKARAVEEVGPYGFEQPRWFLSDESDAALDSEASDGIAGSQAADSGFAGDAQTNNQVAGVDEPDRVKSNGTTMIVANDSEVVVLDLTPQGAQKRGIVSLGDQERPEEMFLIDESKALVFSRQWSPTPFWAESVEGPLGEGFQTSRISEVDLNRLVVTRSVELGGDYVSARQIDSTIRVVMRAQPAGLDFLYPSGSGGEDAATEYNRTLVENSTIESWVPQYRLVIDGDGEESKPVAPCDAVYLPGENAGMATASIITIDAGDDLAPIGGVSVFTDSNTIYSSTDRMVVATPRLPDFDPETGKMVEEDDYRTALHTFDISDPASTTYVASGSVPGSLLNQFSLDVHDGILRVAVTEGTLWWGQPEDSQSGIVTLQESGDELVEIGRINGLGRGEQIYSVRFMGETAYVVTFRQVDPLYVIDLSDPTAPSLSGELKITGFSSYLHSISPDIVIGVGQAGTEDGTLTGAQVSSFDVSDPRRPTKVDQADLVHANSDESGSYSAAEWDHRAFRYVASDRLILVPASGWGWEDDMSGWAELRAIRVDDAGRLTEVGRIESVHTDCEDWEDWEDPETQEAPSDVEADAESADDPATIEPAPVEPPWEECYGSARDFYRSVVVGDVIYGIGDGFVVAVNAQTFQVLDTLSI